MRLSWWKYEYTVWKKKITTCRNIHMLRTPFCMLYSTTHELVEQGGEDLAGADGRVRVVGELEEEEDCAGEELDEGDDDLRYTYWGLG